MSDRREAAARPSGAANGVTPPGPAADRERILLLECRLEEMRASLDAARDDADRARAGLADAATREAGHARRLSVLHQELADARAEIVTLHRHLERIQALRAQVEGYLFEGGPRADAEELVRLRRKVLSEDQRALVSERTVARLRSRVEELVSSRETLLTRVAEWQQLIRDDGPEAADLSEFLAELLREILDLEHRSATSDAREARLRERLSLAGIDPDRVVDPTWSDEPVGAPEVEPRGPADPEPPRAAVDASVAAEAADHAVAAVDAVASVGVDEQIQADETIELDEAAQSVEAAHPAEAAQTAHPVELAQPAEEAVESVEAEAVGSVGAEAAEVGLDAAPVGAVEAIAAPVEKMEAAGVVARVEGGQPEGVESVEAAGTVEPAEAPGAAEAVDAAEAVAPVDAADAPADTTAAGRRPILKPRRSMAASATAPTVPGPEPARARGLTDALVAELAGTDRPTVRSELLLRLARTADPAALEAIRPWTEAPEPSVRAAAFEALGRLLERDPAELEPHLRRGLADTDARVRRRVALTTATARGVAPRSLLAPLNKDPDPQVRRVVREVLRRIPPEAMEPARPSTTDAPSLPNRALGAHK